MADAREWWEVPMSFDLLLSCAWPKRHRPYVDNIILAMSIGVSTETMENWRNDAQVPRPNTLARVVPALEREFGIPAQVWLDARELSFALHGSKSGQVRSTHQWKDFLAHLLEYQQQQHSRTDVPQKYKSDDGYPLGVAVFNVRQGTSFVDYKDDLDAIGFAWRGVPSLHRGPRGGALTCEICGGSLRADSKTGICRRNPECKHQDEVRKARNKGVFPKQLQPCGTYAAWQHHKAIGEEPCDECMTAWRIYKRDESRRRDGFTEHFCSRCGGPIKRDSKTGICQRNPECKLIGRRILKRVAR